MDDRDHGRLTAYFANSQKSLIPQLYLLLSTTIEMLAADKGTVQFFDPRRNTLKIMVQIGFKDEFLRQFSSIIPGNGPWGTAFRTKSRVIIDNIDTNPAYHHLAGMFHNHGYRALQSTPLFDQKKQVFGILTTHFTRPRHCDDNDLAVLDAYLRQAVPIILRRRQAVKSALAPDENLLPQRRFSFLDNI